MVTNLCLVDQPLSMNCILVGAERSRLSFRRTKWLLQLCHSRIQMWSHLGLGLGVSRAPQTRWVQAPGEQKTDSCHSWKYILLESPFLKQPLLFLRYFFHHSRLPPQRWVQGRVRLAGMRTSSLWWVSVLGRACFCQQR